MLVLTNSRDLFRSGWRWVDEKKMFFSLVAYSSNLFGAQVEREHDAEYSICIRCHFVQLVRMLFHRSSILVFLMSVR